MSSSRLRPIERTILRLHREGMSIWEIGRRIKKRPRTVRRIMTMIDYKKDLGDAPVRARSGRTPLEAVVLGLRARGETYGLIGARLARSGAQIRRIESYTLLKSS